MKCDRCNGAKRVTMGFYSIVCPKCEGRGTLTLDQIWKMRDEETEMRNIRRRLEWDSQ